MPKRRAEDPDAVPPPRVEVVPRRGLSRQEAARYVGISAPKFDELVKEGRMPQPFRIGSRVIWDLRKLDDAFDVLSGPEEVGSFTGWEDWDQAASPAKAQAEPRSGIGQAHNEARRRPIQPLMSEEYPGYHSVYTPDTLAEHWKCSASLIRRLIQRGELAGMKYGGKLIRITAATVVAYEDANTVHAKR